MTEQSAIAFAERLKTDEAFCASLAAAPDQAARLAIAGEAGYDLTQDDVPAVKAALGIDELSDDDLEQIAGGHCDGPILPRFSFISTAVKTFMNV